MGGEELPSRYLELEWTPPRRSDVGRWGRALVKRRGVFVVVRVGMGVVAFWDGDGVGFSLRKTGTLGTGWTSFAPPVHLGEISAALNHCLLDSRPPSGDRVWC